MLLNEIIDTTIIDRKTSKPFNTELEKKTNLRAEKFKDMGTQTGLVSKHAPVMNDPHLHKKWNRVAIKDLEDHDPYWYFIDRVVKDKLADKNPHFPRIYKILTIKDPKGLEKRKAEMEELFTLDSLEPEMLRAIIQNLFITNEYIDAAVDRANSKQLIKILMNTVNVGMSDHSGIKNSAYKKAVEFIHNMKNINNFEYDLHDGNIMVRQGAFTPQLVFTDPFFSSDAYNKVLRGEDAKPKTKAKVDQYAATID